MNHKSRLTVTFAVAIAAAGMALAATPVRAQEGRFARRGRLVEIERLRHEACASRSVGSVCSFVRPDGQKIVGTCHPAQDGALACRNVVNNNRSTIH